MGDLSQLHSTLGPSPGAREAWHRGRPRYAVWLARIDAEPLRRRYFAAQTALDGWIRTLPALDAHLTVWVAGFPCEAPLYDDDVAEATLRAQAAAIARSPPLRVEIGGLRAFATVPYLEVRDVGGALGRLRDDLGQLSREQRFAPYVPHVTVGSFTADWPVAPILAAMAPLGAAPPIALTLTTIERVDLDALREGAPLTTNQRVPLREEAG